MIRSRRRASCGRRRDRPLRKRISRSLTGWLLGALAAAGCSAPQPPDVVLIVIDTLRADHLGIYGYRRDTSPRIDAWAEQAAIFDHALATSPWTLPTLGSIFTGELPSRHAAGLRTQRSSWKRAGLEETVPTLTEALKRRGYSTAAIVNNPFLSPEFGLARGFDSYDYARARPAGAVVNLALEQLGGRDERPLFLFVHFIDPHLPYRPPAWARGRFTDGPYERLPGLKRIRRTAALLDAAAKARIVDRYDEEIAYLDLALGRLFEALEPALLDDSMLALVTSDHGEELFDHGGFEHGHSMYQELLRIPLLIRGPGIVPGRRPMPVSAADLAPTIADAAGLDDGGGLALGELAGASLWSSLRSGADLAERPLVAETTLYGPLQLALVEWPLKLVWQPRSGARRLFDLAADPAETVDLAAERPDAADRLEKLLRQRSPGRVAAQEVTLSEETLDELEALGYLD